MLFAIAHTALDANSGHILLHSALAPAAQCLDNPAFSVIQLIVFNARLGFISDQLIVLAKFAILRAVKFALQLELVAYPARIHIT